MYKVQFPHLLFSNIRLKSTHFPDLHFFSTWKKQETSVSIREKAKESHSYESNQRNKTIQNTEQFRRTVNLYSLKKIASDQGSVTVISKRITNLMWSLNWQPNLSSKTQQFLQQLNSPHVADINLRTCPRSRAAANSSQSPCNKQNWNGSTIWHHCFQKMPFPTFQLKPLFLNLPPKSHSYSFKTQGFFYV